jgi:hypothetical protein
MSNIAKVWNRIITYKFHIGWVFGFLLVCISLCIIVLSSLL